MAAGTITVRLPEWLNGELRASFERQGEGPSEGLRRIVEEWWVSRHLPLIEYRPALDGPRPAIKDGPEIWSFILVHRDYGDDFAGLSEFYGGLAEEGMKQALAYYRLFPDRIDEHLRENDRLLNLLEEQSA